MLLRLTTTLFITLVIGLCVSACQVELNTQIDYACTSDDQCIAGFTCIQGTCVATDSPEADAQGDTTEGASSAEDTSAPVEDTTAPVEDTTAPLEDTAEPTEDATAAVEDTTAPVEDTTDPVEDTTAPVEDTTDPVEDAAEPDPCDYELAEGDECDPVCQVGCAEGEACGLAMEALNCLTPGGREAGEPCSVDTLDCAAGLSCLTIPEIAPEDVCFTHCASDADCPLGSCGIDYSDASGASLGFCLPEPCSDVASCCTELGGCLIDEVCIKAGDSSPGEPCLVCEPGMDSANWSFGTPGAPCDDGDPCTLEDLCSDEGQCLPGEPLICSGDNLCEDYACGAEGLCEATWKEANAPCGEGICDAAGTCLLSCTAPALEGAECNFFCGQGEQGCGADQVCALEAGAQSCVNAEVATGGLLAPCSGPDSLCESGYVCAYLEAEQGKRCLPVCSDYADGESACPDGLACELDVSLSLGGDTASTITLCVPTEAPCPVPFEDLCPCPIPQGAECSPYCGASEQGCAEGTSCTVSEAGDTLLCAETGTLKAGEPCATWDECGVGLTCASGESGLACRSFCQSDSECAEIFPSTECELVPLSGGVEVGICTEHLACDLPYPTGAACNAYCPAGAQGCAEGETCILNESNTFECSSGGGDLSTDAPCLSHEACMSGHVCINSPFQAEKTCQPFCVTSDECPEGRECNIWYYAGADEEFQMWMCEPPPCEGCVIDEVCVPEGAPQPDAPCFACVSASNPTGWTMTPDVACDDADPCTDGDTCGLFGECIGSPSSSPECNGCFITAPIGAACNPYCPMGAQGCEAGQGCLFVDDTQSFICGDVGEGALDAPCSSNSSCQTGHICTSIQTQTSFLCNKVCTSDDDCPAERPCAASYALDSETLTMCEADPCPGGCFIDDVCYPDASAHPTFACQVCNPTLSTSAWSLNLGAACDDGDPCTEGSTCGEAGVCQGGQAMPIGTPCPANPTLHALYACDFGGECSFSACAEGFLNCNLSLIDGCEAEVATDPLNCGGCEIACSESDSPANVDVCIDGECAVASCESVSNETDLATSDANGDPSDGCELVCEQTHVDCVYEEVDDLGQPISTGCETMVIELPEESCNGLDDDCDGLTDEGIPGAESDLDGDLMVDCMDPDIDGDGVDNLQDPSDYNAYICGDSDDDGCDDCASLAVSAPLFDGLDTDSDGLCNVGDPDDDGDNIPDTLDGCPLAIDQGMDNDVDGYDIACDCDDSRPSINPGASEACDGVDTDCDGILPDDEKDLDADSFVGCDYQGIPWLGSNPPNIGKDCDDTNYQYWEKLSDTELCDGVDSDCDGVLPEEELDLDGDGYVACMNGGEPWLGLSGDPQGFADCDPTSPSVWPGAVELCDGVQNNCSALAIPDNEVDNDGDGYIECDGWLTEGWLSPDPIPKVGIDCDDTDNSVNPGAVELCDGLSNTCVEEVPADEIDHDGDGYVACPFNQAIWAGDPDVIGGLDCAPIDPSVFEPSCDQKECGDDGCGGSCGTCQPDEHCIESGEQALCSPNTP